VGWPATHDDVTNAVPAHLSSMVGPPRLKLWAVRKVDRLSNAFEYMTQVARDLLPVLVWEGSDKAGR